VSEEMNSKSPSMITPVQLSTPYTDPKCHNTHCHRQTDRRRDDIIMITANHTK